MPLCPTKPAILHGLSMTGEGGGHYRPFVLAGGYAGGVRQRQCVSASVLFGVLVLTHGHTDALTYRSVGEEGEEFGTTGVSSQTMRVGRAGRRRGRASDLDEGERLALASSSNWRDGRRPGARVDVARRHRRSSERELLGRVGVTEDVERHVRPSARRIASMRRRRPRGGSRRRGVGAPQQPRSPPDCPSTAGGRAGPAGEPRGSSWIDACRERRTRRQHREHPERPDGAGGASCGAICCHRRHRRAAVDRGGHAAEADCRRHSRGGAVAVRRRRSATRPRPTRLRALRRTRRKKRGVLAERRERQDRVARSAQPGRRWPA